MLDDRRQRLSSKTSIESVRKGSCYRGCIRPQVSNVVLKTPQRKFEDASAEAPPAAAGGKAGGTSGGTSARSGAAAARTSLSADRPRLRAAGAPMGGPRSRGFGP